jgi:hypothetical protein
MTQRMNAWIWEKISLKKNSRKTAKIPKIIGKNSIEPRNAA